MQDMSFEMLIVRKTFSKPSRLSDILFNKFASLGELGARWLPRNLGIQRFIISGLRSYDPAQQSLMQAHFCAPMVEACATGQPPLPALSLTTALHPGQ